MFKTTIALTTIIFVGWILNIVKLFTCNLPMEEWAATEIWRIVGVFVPPLGAVLSFL